MREILLILLITGMNYSLFAQTDLEGISSLTRKVKKDTIYFDTFWENNQRKVIIDCYSDTILAIVLELNSFESDSTYILGEAIVRNISSGLYRSYVWRSYYGVFFIGKVNNRNEIDNIESYYTNYPDESVKSFTDYSIKPNIEKEYFQGEERLDLSIVRTFPKYFKELYEEKYGAIN